MRDSMLTRRQRRDASDTYYPTRHSAIRHYADDEGYSGVISGAVLVGLIICGLWILGHMR